MRDESANLKIAHKSHLTIKRQIAGHYSDGQHHIEPRSCQQKKDRERVKGIATQHTQLYTLLSAVNANEKTALISTSLPAPIE